MQDDHEPHIDLEAYLSRIGYTGDRRPSRIERMRASRGERDRASDEESGERASDHYARAGATETRSSRRSATTRIARARRVERTSVTKRLMVGHPKSERGECEPCREAQQAARG